MESNKTDTDFRTKINKREIAPSADSWNRLEAMLDSKEQKKRKPMTWLFIAAGILGFLFVSSYLFIGQKGADNQIQVVEQSEKPTILAPILSEPTKQIVVKESIAEVGNIEKVTKSSKGKVKSTTVLKPNESKILVENKQLIAAANRVRPEEKAVQAPISNNEELLQLLAEASLTQQPNHKVKVDARSLLSQVDGELDLTFREKVVKSATKNYQNIKVAVVNRNYE